MAYVGSDLYWASWVPGSLANDLLAEGCILLAGPGEGEAETEAPAAGGAPGYIIRDWFGPFLLGPASSYLRGRC